MEAGKLTIRHAQLHQPWAVPYAIGVMRAQRGGDVPHILATHCALHAAKSVGKLCAVFEAMDHPAPPHTEGGLGWGPSRPSDEQLATIVAMSADLVTAALRFANLYGFDLASALMERVAEKNGVGYADAAPTPE
jgi:hypothetical protein